MADNQFINFNSQDVADMYRRNQYARMLQDQANAPIERASYKGIEADIHPVQGVAKLAAALLAGYQQNQMDERYTNEKAAAEQKMVDERERRKAEVEQYRMGEEPTLSYGPSGGAGDYGTPPTISTAKTPGQLLAHRLNALGSETESVRNMAKASIEQQNAVDQNTAKAAEKERDRLDRKAELDQAQKNFASTQAETRRIADRTFGVQEDLRKKTDLTTAQDLEGKRLTAQRGINTMQDLYTHPGRGSGTGFSSMFSGVAGTDAKGFAEKLKTFKAQTFLSMSDALRGMGSLTELEGQQLAASVGALDAGMKEHEFIKELKDIEQFVYDKAKAKGHILTRADFRTPQEKADQELKEKYMTKRQ